ncbi:MAG: ERF family protein [Campylobacterota bacterium]|nr:ERF family protein [Campylobacterota bacterium]
MSENLGIYKKINNIMKKVNFIAKDGKLGFGNNTFSIVTYDKVISVTREHFVDEGVIIIPHQIEKGISVEGLTKNGGKKIRMEAMYDVSFIDVNDGSKVVVRAEAHAEDNSDKGANKCLTYAVKNAILKVLSLQTGDDFNQELSNKINDKQFKLLRGLLQTSGADTIEFLKHYEVETVADIPQGHYQNAVNSLQEIIKKGK